MLDQQEKRARESEKTTTFFQCELNIKHKQNQSIVSLKNEKNIRSFEKCENERVSYKRVKIIHQWNLRVDDF